MEKETIGLKAIVMFDMLQFVLLNMGMEMMELLTKLQIVIPSHFLSSIYEYKNNKRPKHCGYRNGIKLYPFGSKNGILIVSFLSVESYPANMIDDLKTDFIMS